MPMILMTVAEWIAVPDNPIQRDTEKHAAKAKHLLTPLPIHKIVYAAELPDGKRLKLDGHTRALMWKRKQIPHPRNGVVEVNVVHVQSVDEAVQLYKTLDSKEALETITDKVSGAFNHLNFIPESGLLKRGNIANAVRMCWHVYQGKTIHTGGTVNGAARVQFDLYLGIHEFSNELFALDSFSLDGAMTTSGIVAAFILTNRKHSYKVLPFWRSVFANGGEKKDGKMDGVQALNELMLQRRGRQNGSSGVADICARAVMACEKWLEDEYFTRLPAPFDLTGYIHGVKSKITLIKATNGTPKEKEQ
jgi:hypothetical protein